MRFQNPKIFTPIMNGLPLVCVVLSVGFPKRSTGMQKTHSLQFTNGPIFRISGSTRTSSNSHSVLVYFWLFNKGKCMMFVCFFLMGM